MQPLDAMDVLKATSRTFYIPISLLPPQLKEAVAGAYLCMRAIDEIEDHERMDNGTKSWLLRQVSGLFQGTAPLDEREFSDLFRHYTDTLPSVTLRIQEWAEMCPETAAPIIRTSIADMAERMAGWVDRCWSIRHQEDLDDYTYCVAGAVGELLTDLWRWYDGTETDRVKAVAFGRGLQSVNIIRNRMEDLARGCDYYPDGWDMPRMIGYSRRHLEIAQSYTRDIQPGPIQNFCRIPLLLATKTLDIIEAGKSKLSRADVMDLVKEAIFE